MRYAIITARPHDSKRHEVLACSPEIRELNAAFKKFCADPETARVFCELHLVEVDSGSVAKRKRFAKPLQDVGGGSGLELGDLPPAATGLPADSAEQPAPTETATAPADSAEPAAAAEPADSTQDAEREELLDALGGTSTSKRKSNR